MYRSIQQLMWSLLVSISALGFFIIPSNTAFAIEPILEIEWNGETAGDWFGWSVSIDGDTVVIGAHQSYGDTGSAYVYVRDEHGDWSDVPVKWTGEAAGDMFGASVSIDGDTAVIGTYQTDNDTGSAYVYVRDEHGDWSDVPVKWTGEAAGDMFGASVSIDGDTVVIGAHQPYGETGSAYVYVRDEHGDWSDVPIKWTGERIAELFGRSVSVDAHTVVIGAPNSGLAYVYVRDEHGTWSDEPVKLTVEDGGGDFGFPVSVDGDTVVVGGRNADRLSSVYVFVRDEHGVWSDVPIKWNGEVPDDLFGESVSIDGDTLVIGAPWSGSAIGAPLSGSAYVLRLMTVPHYRCEGFAPPLADSPVRFKRNKALALRAKLFDDAEGVEITGDELSFTDPPVVQVWRSPLDPLDPNADDPVDVSAAALPVGTADDGNQFYYVNTDTGYWQFILDGRSWSAPGRYEVLMDSGDYSDYLIDPTCVAEFVIDKE